MVFQDPYSSLNPRMRVGDIVEEPLIIHGIGGKTERRAKVAELFGLVGLDPTLLARYPHEFSGGQRQRIGIARALALDPDFVVCDEPVSALDVSIQSQVLNLLLDLRREMGLTYLFIAHNLSVVQYISDRVGVMYLGKMMELADVDAIYSHPRHPYTIALLSAIPDPDPRIRKKRIILTGDVPSPAAPPSGCRFHTRCWLRERLGNPENCVTDEPVLRDIGGGQLVACHWAEAVSESTTEQLVGSQVGTDQAIADTDDVPIAIDDIGPLPAVTSAGDAAPATAITGSAAGPGPDGAGHDTGPAGAGGPPEPPREAVGDGVDTNRS
jgi:oligopeptide/dipeptide ABC transporter ATP-binding protein